jgi:hypothetical protein
MPNGNRFDWQRVQGTLLARLHAETHHSCIKHLLALLFVFPVPLPESVLLGNSGSGGTLFGQLRALLDRWPNGATRENIVALMGVCLSQVRICRVRAAHTSLPVDAASAYTLPDSHTRTQLLSRAEEAQEKLGAGALKDMLSVWSGVIQQFSVPEMEWTFRLAVARSIHASGICDYKPGTQKFGTTASTRARGVLMSAWRYARVRSSSPLSLHFLPRQTRSSSSRLS